jgi:hypothetical protein
VDGVGWLEAWDASLIIAMEAFQALAAQRIHKLKNALESTRER